jgi:predicted TIM-barrel enzyme
MFTFHAVRMPGTTVGSTSTRNSVQRVGRKAMVISNRSFDMERTASRIWKVKAGSVVTSMMKKMRNSVP